MTQLPHSHTRDLEHLDLTEVLDCRPDKGIIQLHKQHFHHYGKSDTPVCWSLVGYASGYASACLGQEIYFRENECVGQGAKTWSVAGKDAKSWGDSLEELRFRSSNVVNGM